MATRKRTSTQTADSDKVRVLALSRRNGTFAYMGELCGQEDEMGWVVVYYEVLININPEK